MMPEYIMLAFEFEVRACMRVAEPSVCCDCAAVHG